MGVIKIQVQHNITMQFTNINIERCPFLLDDPNNWILITPSTSGVVL